MLFRFPTENEAGYHFPDASKVEEQLERAQTDSDDHFHFASNLESIYQWILLADQFGEGPYDKIDDLIDNLDTVHPSLAAAKALCEWETDREYQEGLAARQLLHETFEQADNEGWHHVTRIALTWGIKVEKDLNRDISSVIDIIVEYFDDNFVDESDIPLFTFRELLSLIYENHYEADDRAILRAFVIAIRHANRFAAEGQPEHERSLLEDALQLGKAGGIDQRGLARRYIKTFKKQADLQSDPLSQGKILLQGLEDQRVSNILTVAEKQEWKQEMNEAFRSGAMRLRREGTPLPMGDMEDAFWNDVQRKKRLFCHLADRHSRRAAVYWFAMHDEFIPNENPGQQSFIDRISTVAPSDTGHVIQQTPTDNDSTSVSQSYLTDLTISAQLAPQTLYELIGDGILTRGLLYRIILGCKMISEDDKWYLISFLNALFDERYEEAVHLGIPRMESVLFNMLRSKGEDVDALMDSGTGTRTLGSLLNVSQEYIDSGFRKYLRYMYNERLGELAGGNIRNRTAHGHLRMGEDMRFVSYLVLTDILRLIIRLDCDTYRSEFGLISEYELLSSLF